MGEHSSRFCGGYFIINRCDDGPARPISGNFPLFIALGRGLAATRAAHIDGAGLDDKTDFSAALAAIQRSLHPPNKAEPASTYYSAFPHDYLTNVELRSQPSTKSDLLRDLIGSDRASAITLAIDVVVQGRKILAAAPQASIGGFFTVDRDETERVHSVRNLILAYKAHPEDKHPLALAVFGPPGSGKTFIVNEMAADLGGPTTKCIELMSPNSRA